MMRRSVAGRFLLGGFLALTGVRPAAADARCAAFLLDVDSSVRARWPGLEREVRDAFETRADVDRCARVTLTLQEGALAAGVLLPDGRSALRPVKQVGDVVPTLEALLLVPLATSAPAEGHPPVRDEPGPVGPDVAPVRPHEAPAIPFGGASAPPDRDAPPVPSRPPSRLRIEISVLAGARVGDGQTGMGLGALSFLDLSGWLIGFEGRGDRYQGSSAKPTDGAALELALLGGRRFRFRDVALDLTTGPAAAIQGTATFSSRSPATGAEVTQSSSSTVPRWVLGARLNLRALSVLRAFLGVDGEVGPTRAGTLLPGASHLPLWTLGLALGGTVGTL